MNLKSPILIILGLIYLPLSVLAAEFTTTQKPNAEIFQTMRYGIFNHLVYNRTISPDGKVSYQTLDEFVNQFDVHKYADQMESIGVEYVIFTLWHAAMYNLGPNSAMDKWIPGHTAKRDLVGEIADALNEKRIKLIIYAHPNDAHDLTLEEQAKVGFIKPEKGVNRLMPVFNDFINEVYQETVSLYGEKPNVLGFWWDGWRSNGEAVDGVRLKQTVLKNMPEAIVLSNQNTREKGIIDFQSTEIFYHWVQADHLGGKVPFDNFSNLELKPENQVRLFAGPWWCDNLEEQPMYSAETMFRFTVCNAGTGAPGGVAWSVSPTSDGHTWASKNMELLMKLNSYISPIRESLCNVLPCPNWPVKSGKFSALPGYAATRSPDNTKDYLHILTPPQGKIIELPAPECHYTKASLLVSGHSVELERVGNVLRLTLGEKDSWDHLDTVIVLQLEK